MALEQNSKATKKKGGSIEVPDAVYQRLVRMLMSSAIKEEKQGTRAKEIKVTKGA